MVNLHVGTSGSIQRPSEEAPPPALLALFSMNSMLAVIDWIFSRVPIRFPELKVVLSEGGASWVPMMVDRLSRVYRVIDVPGSN